MGEERAYQDTGQETRQEDESSRTRNGYVGNKKPDQYHNEAAKFASAGDTDRAVLIVREGLDKYPYNIDLLADGIAFGNDGYGSQLLERLYSLDRKTWNWRAFTFCVDFYIDRLLCRVVEENERNAMLNEAKKIASEYRRYLPLDERAYESTAKVLLAGGSVDAAMKMLHMLILERTIPLLGDSDEVSSSGKDALFPMPQCCVTYIDLLMERGMYDEVTEVATIGIAGCAQDQPSAETGYLYYVRALAMDAKLHRKTLESSEDVFLDNECTRSVLKDYEIARRIMPSSRDRYMRQIDNRSIAIRILAGLPIPDEDEKRSYITKEQLEKLFMDLGFETGA